jgi:hypothetical protein
MREYQNKPSFTHREEEEILATQERDGKLKPDKNYSLFSKVMMKRKEGAEGILVFFGYEYVN